MLRLCAVDEVVGRVDAEALAKLLDAGFVALTGMWQRSDPLLIDGQVEVRPNAVYHDGVVDDPSLWLLSNDGTTVAEVGEGSFFFSVLVSGALVQTPRVMWSAFDLLRPVVGHFDRGTNGAGHVAHAAWVAEVAAVEQAPPVALDRVPHTTLFVEWLKAWMMDAFLDLWDVAVAESGRSSYSDEDPPVPVTPAIVAAARPRRSLAELRALCVVEARDDGWIDDEPGANPSISEVARAKPG